MTWVKKWYVPSSSSGDTYTVGLRDDGEYQCGCIGWTRHMPRRDCKHIRGIKNQNGGLFYGPFTDGFAENISRPNNNQDLMKRPGRLIDLPD